MYIDLTKLSESLKEFDETVQIELDDESAQVVEPCRIFGILKKGIVQVDIQGNIETRIQLECSRCLIPVKTEMKIPFKASYITREFYTSEKESEIQGEDLEIAIYDGEKIDLADLTREQVLLNLPTQIFCKKDCQGLCPKCGVSLNQQKCNCETKEIDPRWSALKKIKKS